MKVLVTGAMGQLGRSLSVRASEHPSHELILSDITGDCLHLDITSRDEIRSLVVSEGIQAIVNCAAYTNVEGAEDNAALCNMLNADAVAILAGIMKETGGLMVQISSDYVFGNDSHNVPIGEDSPLSPLGVYGSSKAQAEQILKSSGAKYVILRTAWLYSEYGKNFVRTMLRLTSEKPSLQVVFDQVGTPTYAGDLADAIFRVLDSPVPGLFNFSDEGVCSWYDFTKAIAEYSGNTACDVRPCHSSEFPSKVVRPAYSVLDKSLFKCTYCISLPHWTESLKKCLKNLGNGHSETEKIQ